MRIFSQFGQNSLKIITKYFKPFLLMFFEIFKKRGGGGGGVLKVQFMRILSQFGQYSLKLMTKYLTLIQETCPPY